jgi:kynurenine formamidase
MITTGQGVASGTDGEVPGKSAPILRARGAFAAEYFGLIFHGPSVTHLDALSHAFWDGMMYNGRPAAHVTAKDGALEGSMSQLGGGITTRGVLIDLPRLFGTNWLDAGHGVTPGEILAAEDRQGVTIRSGDFLLLRTGDPRRREVTQDTGRQRAGYSASCLPLLHAREVAAIGCDTANDSVPSGFNPGGVAVEPVHMVGIVAMGLWILDNCDFEELAETCARLERYEFLFTVANLRINGATGSPVNPIALL